MEKFDAELALQLIEQEKVTHSQWVPTHFVRMLKLPEEVRGRYDLSSHQLTFHAAAPCPVPVKEAMMQWWGPIIYEFYAGTEFNGLIIKTWKKPGMLIMTKAGVAWVILDGWMKKAIFTSPIAKAS